MKLHIVLLCALLLSGCAPDPASLTGNQPPPVTDSETGGSETDAEPSADIPLEGQPGEPPPAPEPESSEPVNGIDASTSQGKIDWTKVKVAGVSFAFVKATEGVETVDAQFAANWAGMKEAGIVRGAYSVYVAGDDPAEQAAHFLANTKLESGDLPPVVDVETRGTAGDGTPLAVGDLKTHLAALEKGTGVKPIIRTSPSFWDANFDDTFGAYPLWVAEYGVEEPRPVKGWDGWTFWRHTRDGAVDGVDGGVDQDAFSESPSSLRGLTLP